MIIQMIVTLILQVKVVQIRFSFTHLYPSLFHINKYYIIIKEYSFFMRRKAYLFIKFLLHRNLLRKYKNSVFTDINNWNSTAGDRKRISFSFKMVLYSIYHVHIKLIYANCIMQTAVLKLKVRSGMITKETTILQRTCVIVNLD